MTGLLAPRQDGFVQLIAPAHFTSGGPEVTHQLGATLIKLGVPVRVTYTGIRRNEVGKFESFVSPGGCPEQYKKYGIPEEPIFHDDDRNVVVLPQTWASGCRGFHKARVAIWWLGVPEGHTFLDFFDGHDPGKSVVHLYQSEHARRFVEAAGYKSLRLVDHLSDRHFEPRTHGRRVNAVLYNPAKGTDRIELLMKRARERRLPIDWVAIHGMTEDHVAQVMSASKVYVDFGTHPGMDRMPREAAMAGCCVITGMRGSAGYDQDVPLKIALDLTWRGVIDQTGFKFNDHGGASWVDSAPNGASWVDPAIDRIVGCLMNYETEVVLQDSYRDWIKAQRESFVAEAEELFA